VLEITPPLDIEPDAIDQDMGIHDGAETDEQVAAHAGRKQGRTRVSEPITSWLESQLGNYIEDLRYLSGIDSGSYDKAGIDQVQDWFQQHLRDLGFEVQRLTEEVRGDDILSTRTGLGTRKVMLLGHADTVFPIGTAAERPVRIDGDKLIGPGTSDMKAGLLTGLYAIRALDQVGWNGLRELSFFIVSAEEIDDRHSNPLLEGLGPKMDAVLTLEAARENGDIVTSRKAGKWVQIEVFGKSAHAGVEPEKGASATLALAHIIARIFALNAMKPGMTVNPGEISGGSRPNVVADYARVELDVRAWSNSDLDELISAIRRVARQGYVPGTTVEVTIDPNSGSPAMEYTEGTRRLETASLEIAEELGFSLKGASTGGGSDVSFACHAGTPGLDGLGPIGGLDHSPDEYLLISSIVPRTALLAKLLQRIGDGDGFDYAERAG
jgi:glutamate carboxypeptidase